MNTQIDNTGGNKLSYTVAEAVQATGIGRSSIYELFNSGELRSTLVAGRRLILRDDLIALLTRSREAA